MQKNRYYPFKRVCFNDVVRQLLVALFIRDIFFVNNVVQKALFFTNSFLSFHMISTPIRNLGDIAMWWLFFFIYFRLSFQNKFGYKRKYHFYENFCEQHTSGQMMLQDLLTRHLPLAFWLFIYDYSVQLAYCIYLDFFL